MHVKLTAHMVGPQLPQKTVGHAACEIGHRVIRSKSAFGFSLARLSDQLQSLTNLQAICAWKPSVVFLLAVA